MSYFPLKSGTSEFFKTAIIFTVLYKLDAYMFAENSDNNNDNHTKAGEEGY